MALTGAPAIGYLNLADGVALGGFGASGYPFSNLSNPRMSSSWRSVSDVSDVAVSVDLGAVVDIDVVALIGDNLTLDGTEETELDNEDDFPSPHYAPGPRDAHDSTHAAILTPYAPQGNIIAHVLADTVAARYARMTLDDTGNSDGYLSARVLWVGPVWQPELGIDAESVRELVFVGSPGMERALIQWRLVFHMQNRTKAHELESILLNKLRSGRYLIIPHPDRPETFLWEAIYATMVGAPKVVPQALYPYWTTEVTFLEVVD